MPDSHSLFVFQLGEHHFALPLRVVERVARMVEITPLPQMPLELLGVINVQGLVVPVINLDYIFGLQNESDEAQKWELDDFLLIVQSATRTLAVPVNNVTGVVAGDPAAVRSESAKSVVKLEQGLVAVCDPNDFLPPATAHFLDEALAEQKA